MNDHFVNISSLIHRQIDLMERYHTNVNESMERIDNCIQELVSIQQGRDRNVSRQWRLGNSPGRVHAYPYPPRTRTTANLGSNNSRTRPVEGGIHSPFRTTTTTSRLPTRSRQHRARNQMFNRQLERANMIPNTDIPSRIRRFPRRRQMTLQQFINSTMNSGNPRVPARHNEIMQQTTMIGYEDLSGSNITICPISLSPFDVSSNILRINGCNHVFESRSLMRWFREDSRCPLCRYSINRDHEDVSRNDVEENTQDNIFSIGGDDTADSDDGDTESELPSESAIIYDISFSIPQLFGRDMSDNQINSIIDSITSSITNSMTQSLSDYSVNLNDGEEVVVEEMLIEISGNRIDTDVIHE